jgi:hypothetical protein
MPLKPKENAANACLLGKQSQDMGLALFLDVPWATRIE